MKKLWLSMLLAFIPVNVVAEKFADVMVAVRCYESADLITLLRQDGQIPMHTGAGVIKDSSGKMINVKTVIWIGNDYKLKTNRYTVVVMSEGGNYSNSCVLNTGVNFRSPGMRL